METVSMEIFSCITRPHERLAGICSCLSYCRSSTHKKKEAASYIFFKKQNQHETWRFSMTARTMATSSENHRKKSFLYRKVTMYRNYNPKVVWIRLTKLTRCIQPSIIQVITQAGTSPNNTPSERASKQNLAISCALCLPLSSANQHRWSLCASVRGR